MSWFITNAWIISLLFCFACFFIKDEELQIQIKT